MLSLRWENSLILENVRKKSCRIVEKVVNTFKLRKCREKSLNFKKKFAENVLELKKSGKFLNREKTVEF